MPEIIDTTEESTDAPAKSSDLVTALATHITVAVVSVIATSQLKKAFAKWTLKREAKKSEGQQTS